MTALAAAQRAICERYAARYTPVRDDQLCAVSDGVDEGDAAQGVRYSAPEHMTGWYITTARYNGDHRSLRVEHVAHLLERRPDIAPLLALPPGYRFDVNGTAVQAWRDPAVEAG
jgi:hypothetical protein